MPVIIHGYGVQLLFLSSGCILSILGRESGRLRSTDVCLVCLLKEAKTAVGRTKCGMSIAVPQYPQDPWQKQCLFANIPLLAFFCFVGKLNFILSGSFEINKL